MEQLNTEIFLTAQKEVDRLIENLEKMGSLSDQQDKARTALEETGQVLTGFTTELSELIKRIRELADKVSHLDPVKLADNLKSIETSISEVSPQIEDFKKTIEEAINTRVDSHDTLVRTNIENLQTSIMKDTQEQNTNLIDNLQSLKESLQNDSLAVNKRVDLLEENQRNLQKRQQLLTFFTGTSVIFLFYLVIRSFF